MRKTISKSHIIAAAAIALSFGGTALKASADTTVPNTGIQYNGLFDGYFLYQFQNPKGSTITGRSYDYRTLTPALNLAELNVYKTAKPGGFGWKTTIGAGDIADANGEGDPTREGRWKNLMQAYGTYAFKNGGNLDFGKFYTPFGYEVYETNGNFNYSHSMAFAILPVYHFGFRAVSPTYNGWTFTGFVVNTLIDSPKAGVTDDNGQPAYILSANWTDPKGKWVVVDSIGAGKDKYNLNANPDTVNNKNVVNDFDLTYNFDANHIGGLNYSYVKTDPDNSTNATYKTTANAYAVYYKQILTPKTSFALRYSYDETKTEAPAATTKAKPWEVTATYDVKAAANFLTRFEYRHDGSNNPIFLDSDGNATKKEQDTVAVAGVFTF